MSAIIPKKHLGQHFLRDPTVAQRIVSALDLKAKHRHIIEIGPGTGALTTYLQEKIPERLFLIELDRTLLPHLQQQYPNLQERIYVADFLTIDLPEKWSGPLGIIGNFPYNISTQIFFKVLAHRQQIEEVVGMVQHEVAERITAPPGSKKYGILSVLLQAFYKTEYLFTVPPEVFTPPPQVRSGVLRLRRNDTTVLPCDEILFFQVVKTAFQQRRKQLHNALKGRFPVYTKEGPWAQHRPEQLAVADFVTLTQWLGNTEV